jgi:hypothetical protein
VLEFSRIRKNLGFIEENSYFFIGFSSQQILRFYEENVAEINHF